MYALHYFHSIEDYFVKISISKGTSSVEYLNNNYQNSLNFWWLAWEVIVLCVVFGSLFFVKFISKTTVFSTMEK